MIKRDILITIIVILIIAIIGVGFAILSHNNSFTPSNNSSNQNASMNVTVNTTNPSSSSDINSKTPEAKSYTCSYCKGVGYYESKNICKACNGIGKIGNSICPTCQGSGSGEGTKKIRCDGCGGDGILNPGDPGYGNPI